jgi:uncharacterized repeat protein (TIGR02543 family)
MRRILNLRKGEAGQALLFVTIALGLCAIVISATLGLSYAGHRSTEIKKAEMQQYYAADTGIEDALYRIGLLSSPLPDISEDPPHGNMTVNGYDVSYTITRTAGAYIITSTASYPSNLSGPDTTVEASAPICTLEIKINPPAGGNTAPSAASYTYRKNTTVSLQAVANEGYNWKNWSGNGTVDMDNPNAASTTIKMKDNYTIQANFEEEGDDYWLYIEIDPSNGGTTTPSAGNNHTYSAGTQVNLIADPANCYRFIDWTGDGTVVNPSDPDNATITMDGNYTITANFTQKLYNLTLSAIPPAGGSVTGAGRYVCGIPVAISATPASGYAFVNWTGGPVVNPSSPTTTITMNGDYSIMANFALDAPCYPCFHYAVATLGDALSPFVNSGDVVGDIYVSYDAGLSNSFFVDGTLYADGDLDLANTIDIDGNAHVLGDLTVANSIQIWGDAYVDGDITLTNSARIWGNAYATGSIHISNSSRISGDAYAGGTITTITGGSVGGTKHPNYDVVLPPFPYLEPPLAGEVVAQAAAYKAEAQAGVTITGNKVVANGATWDTAGPVYITGNLIINNNAKVKMRGTIFVEGYIQINNNVIITVDDPPDGHRYALVAKGNIDMNNNITVDALGDIPIIMSVYGGITYGGNKSCEGVLYAPNGNVTLANSVEVYGSVVGLKVTVANSNKVTHAPELDGGQGLPACGCGG